MESEERSLTKIGITRDHIANSLALMVTITILIGWGMFVKHVFTPRPDKIHIGTNIRIYIYDNQQFEIASNGSVTAVAISDSYFTIDNSEDDNDPFAGYSDGFIPYEKYSRTFHIQNGTWTVRESVIELELTNDNEISLTVHPLQGSNGENLWVSIVFFAIALFMWLICLWLIKNIVKPSWHKST